VIFASIASQISYAVSLVFLVIICCPIYLLLNLIDALK